MENIDNNVYENIPKRKFKDRINYIIQDGKYCGFSVNMPQIICQGKDFEDMKRKIRIMYKMWIKFVTEGIEDVNEFNFVDYTDTYNKTGKTPNMK